MLPRSQRLSGDQVRQLFSQKTAVFHTPLLSFRIKKIENTEKSRFSVIITKKVCKMAVTRNHIRRQIYTILATLSPLQSGYYAVTVKKIAQFSEFQKDIEEFFTTH